MSGDRPYKERKREKHRGRGVVMVSQKTKQMGASRAFREVERRERKRKQETKGMHERKAS